MKLQNGRVTAVFSDNTGVLVALRDEERGIDFVQNAPAVPFRITLPGSRAPREITDFSAFSMEKTDGGLNMTWTHEEFTLTACVTLLPDGIAFSSRATCGEETEITLVEYPLVDGIASLGADSTLIHSFATGVQVFDPLKNLKDGEGFRYAPYPESFSGATMQFFAYTSPRGGLYFAAEDSESHAKWLNVHRQGSALIAGLMYGMEDMGKGKPVSAPYPFTLRFLSGGGWEEAAARYKAWAVHQPWCEQGPIAFREHCQWLMQKVGLCTFGINAGHDRSPYIRRYHRDVGTPVFHVLGPDWTNTPQTFYGVNPGGLPDWVPTRFNLETLSAIREVGDYFAPFEFDLMALPGKGDDEQVRASHQRFPEKSRTYSIDAYDFPMLCPCEPYTQYMHRERDAQIVREAGVDAMYYDISANNLLHICLREDHHHPVGGGNAITKGYQTLYDTTKAACAKESGRYFPIGTEMMNEVFLPQLDYYQARAGARPASALELYKLDRQLREGTAELIPLFAYVYHEYGTVRMDGWGKLVEELGDFFYDAAAKIYLWGGLYELNYEYSPAEALDGAETSAKEHYWPFEQYGYEYASGRARYLRQFAALRTGAGNRYLAYGQMMNAPRLDIPLRKKHYYHYNHGKRERFTGEIALPAVRVSAYRSCDKDKTGYAIFLANTELDALSVSLTLSAADYPGASTVTLLSDFDPDSTPHSHPLCTLDAGTAALQLTLAPRKVVMLLVE